MVTNLATKNKSSLETKQTRYDTNATDKEGSTYFSSSASVKKNGLLD